MRFSCAVAVLSAFTQFARAQNCPSNDNGQCNFEPFNPVTCGDDNCGYENFCLAEAAGFSVDNDCCQAPQPSACVALFDPQVCGSKECRYGNLCVAELAGYSSDQCSPAPEECPDSDSGNCSGEPSNPLKCGSGKQCTYESFCLAKENGFDTTLDCCQDVRENVACTADLTPVSCGAPGGKQCPYDNQCLADASGYNEKQCCAAVPDGIVCTGEFAPVNCGQIPCQYSNQCEASAAGWDKTTCCPVAQGACTSDSDPVECGENKCKYSSQSCASAAGFSNGQCCKQPQELGVCTQELDEVACGSINCVYANKCIAELAGFDPNSCVTMANPTVANPTNGTATNGDSSGAIGKKHVVASVGAVLLSFLA